MSKKGRSAKKLLRRFRVLLVHAAEHIESAADIIEGEGLDDFEEAPAEREFAAMLRKEATQ